MTKLAVVIPLLLYGCATTGGQPLDSTTLYRKDIDLEVCSIKDDKSQSCTKGRGFVVAPPGEELRIKGSFPSSSNKLSFKTCARYQSTENDGEHWKYQFKMDRIEKELSCGHGEVVSFNDKGKDSFGAVIFPKSDDTLNISMTCNGEEKTSSILTCQNYIGMPLQVRSPVVADMAASEGCGLERKMDLVLADINMPAGLCLIRFREINPPHRKGRLILYGFESDPVRGK